MEFVAIFIVQKFSAQSSKAKSSKVDAARPTLKMYSKCFLELL